MNAANCSFEPFCVPTNGVSDKDIMKVLHIAVMEGANFYEYLEGFHDHEGQFLTFSDQWKYFGADDDGDTILYDCPSDYSCGCVILTSVEEAIAHITGCSSEVGQESPRETQKPSPKGVLTRKNTLKPPLEEDRVSMLMQILDDEDLHVMTHYLLNTTAAQVKSDIEAFGVWNYKSGDDSHGLS